MISCIPQICDLPDTNRHKTQRKDIKTGRETPQKSMKKRARQGTSAFCSKEECDGEVGNMRVDGEVLKLHVMEMEAIKSAFKSKVAKVDDMKRQLEQLQSCVMDEQKKKSFWTVLSSATTVLAAVSLAYVAHGH